ncbi:MAG: hypothetical protein AB7D92_07550 [Sphaerochaeta sp.]
MRKRWVSIGIVLLALVFLMGCEEGSSASASEQEIRLVAESLYATSYIPEPTDENITTLSFDYTLTSADIYDIESSLESLQFITAGTTIEGSVSFTGGTYAELWGEGDEPTGNPRISITYNITVSGSNIPNGSAEIEVYMAGPYEEGPDTTTVELNGKELNYSEIIEYM